MNNSYTIKKLFEEMCELEVKHHLFEKQINGVYWWKLIRFALFAELSQKLGLYEDGHPGTKPKPMNKIIKVFRKLYTGTFKSLLRDSKKYDVLLATHPRKVMVDGVLQDIYSNVYESEWKKSNISYCVEERSFAGDFLRPVSSNIYHHDWLSFQNISDIFRIQSRLAKSYKYLTGIDAIASIPISDVGALSSKKISSAILDFKRSYSYYIKSLSRHSIKRVYVVVAYGLIIRFRYRSNRDSAWDYGSISYRL